MKKKLIAIIMIMPMIFTACSSEKNKPVEINDDFKKVLKYINKSREDTNQRTFNMDEKYVNWFKKEEDLTEEECKNIFRCSSQYLVNKDISINEAKQDVDMLFKIFRYCYGAYGYFGGDKAFNKAKEDILKEVESKKEISTIEFEELIFNNLKFIKDMHFYLSNGVLFNSINKFCKNYYVNSDCYFFKDDKGYYKLTEDKKYYIEEINEEKEIAKLMKLTVTGEGKLGYTIAILDDLDKDDSSNREVNIKYTNEDDKKIEKLTLTQINNRGTDYKRPVYSVDNNVPIAQLRAMDINQDEFIESGKKIKDYPVSIIDLRGTGGGTCIAGLKWLENYAGHKCETNRAGFKLNSNYYKYHMLEKFNYKIEDKPLFDVIKPDNIKIVPNKNIIFLLVDKANLSASELFIEYMKQMNNVILVGTNTSGCTLSLDIVEYNLKNSGIHFNLGSVFCMTPYFDGFEFKGFEPDILVESPKALEKIQKLIEYYGLNKRK